MIFLFQLFNPIKSISMDITGTVIIIRQLHYYPLIEMFTLADNKKVEETIVEDKGKSV